jgi:hypothetical protein
VLALAQTAAIEIEHILTGETPSDLWLVIRNTGEVPIRGIELYVDGRLRDEMRVYMSPGTAIKSYLYVPAGEHFFELKTPEGAYFSLNYTVAAIAPPEKEKPPEVAPPEEVVEEVEEAPPKPLSPWLIALVVLATIAILWIAKLTYKPREAEVI